ncbi:MerR family transcriptional regulator [Peribacillus frigoritolerans]
MVQLSGVRYRTIKYYTEEGLVPFEQEDIRLTRRYPRVKALERLAGIKRLIEYQGLTIKEIKGNWL